MRNRQLSRWSGSGKRTQRFPNLAESEALSRQRIGHRWTFRCYVLGSACRPPHWPFMENIRSIGEDLPSEKMLCKTNLRAPEPAMREVAPESPEKLSNNAPTGRVSIIARPDSVGPHRKRTGRCGRCVFYWFRCPRRPCSDRPAHAAGIAFDPAGNTLTIRRGVPANRCGSTVSTCDRGPAGSQLPRLDCAG